MGLFINIMLLGTGAMALISGIAIAYIILATYLSRWLSNARRMRVVQAQVKVITKELQALAKAKAPPAEILAKQKVLMPLINESMKNSMKPMIVLLPLTFILYNFVVPALPIPASGMNAAHSLFFIVLVIGGIIASIISYYWDKHMLAKEAIVSVTNSPTKVI